MPESLYKYTSAETAEIILNTGTLRWSSPELFNEAWAIGHSPELDFDHITITKAMLKQAVSMIFIRDMPAGNEKHPLFKAIRRWRTEDRFKDEVEAYDSLSELLAPTPETLESKLKHILSAWVDLVANSRILCLSESPKDVQSWKTYADNHTGVVFKFSTENTLQEPKKVEYGTQRCQLTTVKEQVDDLVGIKRATTLADFESKLLAKPKHNSAEREWRCIQIIDEEDLDCGEDIEDWFIDQKFYESELRAAYFGFLMPEAQRKELALLIKAKYPKIALFNAIAIPDQYELEFKKYCP
ncbi:MAG: DUF2971 domain-containing protein [Pseudomonadales bacterium]|nr:DUF2971 domain-containing protein [Pseudomonadales bacterium]